MLSYFYSCKKHSPNPTLPQLKGSWTLVKSGLNAQIMLSTGTGLVAYYGSPNQSVNFSSDGGVTWSVVFPDTFQNGQNNIVVDVMNTSRLLMYSFADSALYISTNGGQSWSFLNRPGSGIYNVSPAVYLSGVSGNRIFGNADVTSGPTSFLVKSDDLGMTWNTIPSLVGLGSNPFFTGGALYTFGGQQTFRSTDNGASWSSLSTNDLTYMGQLTNGNILGYNYKSVVMSTDTCNTWKTLLSVGNNSVGNGRISNGGIAFDSCVLVLASYQNASVVCCNPNKNNWYAADQGLPGGGAFYLDSQYVYYTTSTNSSLNLSIYRRPRSDFANM